MSKLIRKNLLDILDNLISNNIIDFNTYKINNKNQYGGNNSKKYSQSEVDQMISQSLHYIIMLYQQCEIEKQIIKKEIAILIGKQIIKNQNGGNNSSRQFNQIELDKLMTNSLQHVFTLYQQSDMERRALKNQLEELKKQNINSKLTHELLPPIVKAVEVIITNNKPIKVIQYLDLNLLRQNIENLTSITNIQKIKDNIKGSMSIIKIRWIDDLVKTLTDFKTNLLSINIDINDIKKVDDINKLTSVKLSPNSSNKIIDITALIIFAFIKKYELNIILENITNNINKKYYQIYGELNKVII